MGNPSPGSSPSTSATVPLILHRQNGYQATSSIPLSPSLSPSASPMAISRRTIVLLNHCDVEKNFLDESDAQENAGPIMSSVPLASPPNAATTLSLAPSLERQGGQRKRRRSGSDSDYSPPYSLRGGGRPQKSKARRNANNGPHSGQSQSDRSSRRTTRSKARRANSPSSLIITSLEDIKSEDAAVKSEISRLGLTLRDVQGDGNCLFRCLSDQLYGTEKRHAEIRKVVCDYLDSHKETMEGFVVPFMKEGEKYEGYVQRMRQSKQFGSHIEIQAAARIFQRDIRVVMSTASFTIPWRAESSCFFGDRKYDAKLDLPEGVAITLRDGVPSIQEGRTMLWLALFSQAEHFQSIRRRGDKDNGSANIDDHLAVPHAKDTSEAARRERGEIAGNKVESLSSRVAQLLASLPPGHGISSTYAEGVLSRVKGDLGEAIEILLEEIQLEADKESESSSDQRVEELLHELAPSSTACRSDSSVIEHCSLSSEGVSYRARSPALSSTTGTRSRSESVSERSSSGSVTSDLAQSQSSRSTTVSSGQDAPRVTSEIISDRKLRTRSDKLGKDLQGMVLRSRESSREPKKSHDESQKRRASLRLKNRL
ncbi:hypothetical protein C343_06123 [Cryptococcus neoformans C23]|uniref:OTU domain-containing protein n=2 Tax=Cryptococcus neoformans TaxID=5207 RepID=J9VZA4_CRYN9|nr:hypothetical protein CNAG_01765 [Cryptococcus neoformans var. grubii H99]XP_012052742.1 hypothetical protein, variant [Cryptococcus neoformans var. grubii H99]AUB28053.1 hypothetical protein CKF44_01765 [Cryptococcus neoformans var. grubii]OWZ27735.1 hypothetical protein C347_06162 [Cryptococcus neoformans var. grubii AD2-60a]OWZ31881.1 hypothetical protein C353_06025 [Cryptococcus neoformans var. grubii AD1-83a]OWZ40039.1 hypothetical protein C343_06123 [Cryptococcus neoformans var. grubii|eukprot:XP_012052447.1 hypothetical protein CNAG_01765 [Cryptococcus neoformans var. grubii H99]